MNKQRFPFGLSFWTGEAAEIRHLRAGGQFRFDLDALNAFCLGNLPRHLVDLLRIASAVYVVDRLVKRRSKNGPKPPSRTIGLKVQEMVESIWSRQEVRDSICEVLDFLTGDFWDIEFERDSQAYEWTDHFLPFPKSNGTPLICLYSGGLDSAAGLALQGGENCHQSVIPVTVWHQPRQRHLIKRQLALLRAHYRSKGAYTDIAPLIMKEAMIWEPGLDPKLQEFSQRGRAFLFASLGAVAAILHEQPVINVFESGVGAINLPLMAGMVGPKSTRNSHPQFLKLMSRLASLVADADIQFCLPFFDATKGEMVRRLAELGLEELATESASCVHYPRPGSRHKQCGACPGCIGRRQAMAVAGIDEPVGTYEYDLFGQTDRLDDIPEMQLAYLKATLIQVAQLQGIESSDRLPPPFERHVVGTGIVCKGQPQKGVIQLLARYRDEWTRIASLERERGHAWANLLATKLLATQGVTYASA
jgi:7-cyano-7-deazaguanine synthase in queuosine biosynthesis